MLSSTDSAGRVSTTEYDYADRPVGQYGPAPASCFAGQIPTGECWDKVPATNTKYDEGMKGLSAPKIGMKLSLTISSISA